MSEELKPIEQKIEELVKLAARAGASGSTAWRSGGYVIDIAHGGNVDALQKAKGELLETVRAAVRAAVKKRGEDILDWLETQVVEVREPLRYGSVGRFTASPDEQDGGPDLPSDLRNYCAVRRDAMTRQQLTWGLRAIGEHEVITSIKTNKRTKAVEVSFGANGLLIIANTTQPNK